ncbi:AAA family ATPase [Paenibacillus sp. alder61]|uniref:AAA family ATPase n=1 Tax=Paenibacillus sp. alder61 TaxID=2862948 RepID=UPI001CD5C534|nr:AAA family ATPase [Paenibacillus sp. alder61]MCA1292990.1 AAA family ATPase [Paenibacillus sp. alder61]
MKPISLKLSGLQSYREMQEIDFTALCDTGLFGIFGPTGSGKSTLLDAITLAMYGKVGRASGGTQGIMNHSEDALFVAFTFELMSAKGAERYRVERRFKRQGELSVSNTISRFIEITPEGERVLADKLAEVTRQVEEKIGLKMDDFTRAVVLPQGKFAEFLSLKGVDRRQMLQRLFHLEKYGDLLAQKLSKQVKETEQRLKQLAAEQQGLGDASEEALQGAQAALQSAAELAEARRRELGEAQHRAAELAKVRELSRERAERAALLAALRERDAAVREQETRLARAQAAETLRPVLTAWKAARRQAEERGAAAARAAEAAAAGQAAAARAAAEAEAAAGALSRDEPALLLRLDQLEQARLLQRECDALAAELRELAASREQGASRRRAAAEELHKEEQLLAKAKQRQQELEAQLKECEVKPAERQNIQSAVLLKQHLERCLQEAERAMREESRQREKAEQAEQTLARMLTRERDALELGRKLAETAAECLGRLQTLEAEGAALEAQARRMETSMRLLLKQREEEAWSRRLAERLRDGEPCPVCGSLHHPGAVDEAASGEPNSGEEQLNELSAVLSGMRDWRHALSRDADQCRTQLELLDAAESLSPMAGAVRREAAAAAEALKEPEEPISVDASDVASVLAQVHELRQRQAQLRPVLDDLQREVRDVKGQQREIQAGLAAARAEAAAARELLEQMALKSAGARAELESKRSDWAREFGGMTPEEAERLRLDLDEKDRRSEDVKQRLAVSIPFIEEKTARIAELGRDLNERDKLLLQWEVQEQGKASLYQEKHERLISWIGEAPLEAAVAEAGQKLEGLRTAVERSRRSQAESEAVHRDTAQADALARQALTAAVEQEKEWEERWRSELSSSPFQAEEEVREAFLEPAQTEGLAERIRVHREQEREHEIGLKELDAKLGGRIVTEAEWEACSQALEQSRAQDEAALQAKARAERDLEDLERRHLRWKELEDKRLQLEHRFGLLGKLQSSLRGNAFVEYVAEEQLMSVSRAASGRLRSLTKQRYALETDSGGGFVICDDANGGVKRPVSTLSGGETFLTSLALALALSAQIQLRGQYPLQFFFLDEGFGTLDPELLDTVITSLEHLHHDHLAVGIITHVTELRARLARKLVVIPAESGGAGSKIMLEQM